MESGGGDEEWAESKEGIIDEDAGLGEIGRIDSASCVSGMITMSRIEAGGEGTMVLSGDEGTESRWPAEASFPMSVHCSDSLDWPGLEVHVAKELMDETLLNLDHRPLSS